jgi:hypothetical protein
MARRSSTANAMANDHRLSSFWVMLQYAARFIHYSVVRVDRLASSVSQSESHVFFFKSRTSCGSSLTSTHPLKQIDAKEAFHQ